MDQNITGREWLIMEDERIADSWNSWRRFVLESIKELNKKVEKLQVEVIELKIKLDKGDKNE